MHGATSIRWASAKELTNALQRTQAALVAEVAPKVRSFLRFAENQTMVLTILLTFVPIALGIVLARHSHVNTLRGAGVVAILALGTFSVMMSITLRSGRLLYNERRNGRMFRRLWKGWFGRAIFWKLGAG